MVSAKIEYIIMLIKLFARHFGLSFQQAYRYVSIHQGIIIYSILADTIISKF